MDLIFCVNFIGALLFIQLATTITGISETPILPVTLHNYSLLESHAEILEDFISTSRNVDKPEIDTSKCSEISTKCHIKASCILTDGSRTCVCNTGYTGNGIICAAFPYTSMNEEKSSTFAAKKVSTKTYFAFKYTENMALSGSTEGSGGLLSPTDVRITHAKSKELNVTWEYADSSTTLTYRVYYQYFNESYECHQDTANQSKYLVLTGLVSNTKYSISVAAKTSSDILTNPSDEVTGLTTPDVPLNVNVELGNDRKQTVNVTFDEPKNGADWYETIFSVIDKIERTFVSSDSPIFVNNLTPGQTYTVVVIANNSAGYSETSSSALITMEPLPVDELKSDNFTDESIVITWTLPLVNDSTPAIFDNLLIKYSNLCDGINSNVLTVSNHNTSYNITGLISGANYTIEVSSRSQNVTSESVMTYEATVTLPPSNLSASQTTTSLEVHWNPPPDRVQFETYFLEYFIENVNNKSAETRTLLNDRTTYNITGLCPGTKYSVSLSSEGARPSKPVTGSFSTRPDFVKDVRLQQSNGNPTGELNLTWGIPDGKGDNITIDYSSFQSVINKRVVSFNDTTTSLSVMAGNKYTVVMTVFSNGLPSREISVVMNSKPSEVEYEVEPTSNALIVSWTLPEGYYEGFVIKYGQVYFPANQTVNLSSSSTYYTISNLNPYSNFSVQMYSWINNSYGRIEQSAATSSFFTTLSGAPDLKNENAHLNSNVIQSQNTITFVLPANTFTDQYGPIQYYGVYIKLDDGTDATLTQPDVEKQESCDNLYNGETKECVILWTDSQGQPRQDNQRKKRSSEHPIGNQDIKFVIGDKKVTLSPWNKNFTNILLQPNTGYHISVAAKTGFEKMTATNWSSTISTIPIPTNDVLIVGVVVGVMAAVALVIGGTYFYLKRQPKVKRLALLPFNKLEMKLRGRKVKLSAFNDYMDAMQADSSLKLRKEYQEDLKRVGQYQSTDAALLAQNKKKNRYSNILPYDATRVKLLSGNDYINANFITGYNRKKEFIATQGPLPTTVNDFWQMIWEQNSRNIVMVTQIKEKGRVKCHQYWPSDLVPMEFGYLRLQLALEHETPNWTIREFQLTLRTETRKINHFHYTAWPDHGVPDTAEHLVQFICRVRRKIEEKPTHTRPTTVHCSAGVGRTGTFIAMDHLLQHMKKHSYVDIFEIVRKMRLSRMFLVQAESQYILLHQMVKDVINHAYDRNNQAGQIGDLTGDLDPIYENTLRELHGVASKSFRWNY